MSWAANMASAPRSCPIRKPAMLPWSTPRSCAMSSPLPTAPMRSFGGAVVIEGGTIDTCNRQGHGVDASYGGHVYCNGTVIHTGGRNSGALATDFQGGYITVRDIDATTEIPGSPGIYTRGKSIITAYNSKFLSKGCEAVMVAHSLGHTYLYDCELTGTVALNTHNSMSPEYSLDSYVRRQAELHRRIHSLRRGRKGDYESGSCYHWRYCRRKSGLAHSGGRLVANWLK